MNGKRMVKNIGVWGCALMILMGTVGGRCAVASPDTFGYQSGDPKETRQKYLEQLREDKKKVEHAIGATETLINTSRNRPYLPELYVRLAELFIEKSRIVYFIRKGEAVGETSGLNQFESNTLKNRAVEIYRRIIDDFPDYADRDKVHFFMAHEYRELNDTQKMLDQYRIITGSFPESSYVPESYLLMGDYFMGQSDVKTAKANYRRVLSHNSSQAAVIARYKLAWCHINTADYDKAIRLFEQAVNRSNEMKDMDIDTYRRVDIRQEALMDMAYCYTECYKNAPPEEAFPYFEKYAWSRQVYTAVLEKLAYRYLIKKKYDHAAVIYREIAGLQEDGDKLLEYTRHIFECVKVTDRFDHADTDMALMVKALTKQRYAAHIADTDKAKVEKTYEQYARDMVTRLHAAARKAGSKKGFHRAADAYAMYLDYFKEGPAMAEMNKNYAEALFSTGDYVAAGRRYEQMALAASGKEKARKDMLYSAVIAYHSAITHKDSLNAYELACARDGLGDTGIRYVDEFPTSRYVADVSFNVAWIAYDAGQYDRAIDQFSRFVDTYPEGKPAKAAIHLVLDAYHLKNDHQGLIRFGRNLLADKRVQDVTIRKEVADIVKAAESRVVSNLTITAMDDWETGKKGLMAFAGDHRSSAMGEQALNALILSAQDKKDLVALFSAGEAFVKKYPRGDQTENTLKLMIDTALKAGQYRMAATYMELFTSLFPKHDLTLDLLYQSGRVRRSLGQYALSNDNFSRLVKTRGVDSKKVTEAVFSMADNYLAISHAKGAVKVLADYRKKLPRRKQVQAYAQIAALCLRDGDIGTGLKYRKKVLKNYGSTSAGKDRDLDSAMAEMAFEAANREFDAYMAISLSGSIDNAVVARKAELRDRLEKGYGTVMGYPAPRWVLSACDRAARVNQEFARFLLASPLPDLPDDQRKSYVDLVEKKAVQYRKKASEYEAAFTTLSNKQMLCTPVFTTAKDNGKNVSPLSAAFNHGEAATTPLKNSLQDEHLRELHEKHFKAPEDGVVLLALSKAYFDRGDYRQAMLAAENGLAEECAADRACRAEFYNQIGLACLLMGADQKARDAFRHALDNDKQHIGARVNLAGLYAHYGHDRAAYAIYETLPGKSRIEGAGQRIHDRARTLYLSQRKGKRKS